MELHCCRYLWFFLFFYRVVGLIGTWEWHWEGIKVWGSFFGGWCYWVWMVGCFLRLGLFFWLNAENTPILFPKYKLLRFKLEIIGDCDGNCFLWLSPTIFELSPIIIIKFLLCKSSFCLWFHKHLHNIHQLLHAPSFQINMPLIFLTESHERFWIMPLIKNIFPKIELLGLDGLILHFILFLYDCL